MKRFKTLAVFVIFGLLLYLLVLFISKNQITEECVLLEVEKRTYRLETVQYYAVYQAPDGEIINRKITDQTYYKLKSSVGKKFFIKRFKF